MSDGDVIRIGFSSDLFLLIYYCFIYIVIER